MVEDSGGSQLVIWVVGIGWDEVAGAFQTKYRRGTIADAATVIVWGTPQVIDAALNDEGISGAEYCIALARTDNGRIVVAFTEQYNTMGKDYVLTKLIGSDGDGASPSWSGETTWDDPSGNSNNQGKADIWFGLESFSSSYSNRVLLYARIPDGFGGAYYRIVTAVPEWNGTVFSNTTQSPSLAGAGISNSILSALIDESDIPHIVYMRGSNEIRHNKSSSGGNDNWMDYTLVVGVLTDAITITLDTGLATDLLYVFYHKNVDSVDWNYKTSPVGTIAWSSEKTVSYHADIVALSSWNRVIENSLHIAGLYGTDVIYNEHPVYKGLSTTLADLEFPDQNYYLGPHSI
jgi:hypothetical protein